MIKIYVFNFWILIVLIFWFIYLYLIINKLVERYIVYNRSFFIFVNLYVFCGLYMLNGIIICYNCLFVFYFVVWRVLVFV